jgi:hypothetical protein
LVPNAVTTDHFVDAQIKIGIGPFLAMGLNGRDYKEDRMKKSAERSQLTDSEQQQPSCRKS